MRVVLDTNVFVSGIHWSGDSRKIIDAWTDDLFELVCSPDIIKELTRILKGFKKPLSDEFIVQFAQILLKDSVLTTPTAKLDVVKDDESDNRLIEAAVEGKADYIVTQDNHLLKIGSYKGIIIVKPSEFLQLVL